MKKNNGFSIVELLVAMVVSFIVVSGLYSLLTSSVVNFGFSKATNNASDANMRISKFLDGIIFQSGFVNYTRELQASEVKFNSGTSQLNSNLVWKSNQIVSILDDELYIRYYGASVGDDVDPSNSGIKTGVNADTPNGFIYDCNGRAVPNNIMVEARLHVTAQGLVCNYKIIDTNTGTVDPQEQQVVLDPSIVAARFLVADSKTNGNQFSRNPANWSKVDVLVYSFISSQNTSQRLMKTNSNKITLKFFSFSDQDDLKYEIPDDQASNVHRVYSNTVQLVNARL